MKAVVLEIRKKEAAVLVEDGQIIKIRRLDLQPGDTVEISEAELQKDRTRHFSGKITRYATAAAIALALLGGGGTHVYNTALACSYVSLDINPSIEYVLNRQNEILDVRAVNDDAKEIVAELKEEGIRKDSLSEALKKTTEILEINGYITEDTDYVIVNVASDDKKRSKVLKKEANKVFDEINKKNTDNVHLTLTDSSIEQRKKAKELGISSGKYEELKEIKENSMNESTQDTDANQSKESGSGGSKTDSDSDVKITLDDIRKYRDYKIKDLLEESGNLSDTAVEDATKRETTQEDTAQKNTTQKNTTDKSNLTQKNTTQKNTTQNEAPGNTKNNDSSAENENSSVSEKQKDNSDDQQQSSSGNRNSERQQTKNAQSENTEADEQNKTSSSENKDQNSSQEKNNTQNDTKENKKADTGKTESENTKTNEKQNSDNSTKGDVNNTKENSQDIEKNNTNESIKDNSAETDRNRTETINEKVQETPKESAEQERNENTQNSSGNAGNYERDMQSGNADRAITSETYQNQFQSGNEGITDFGGRE